MNTSRLSPPGLLAGRSAVITGGSRGIGLAIASVFAEAGAAVVIGARDTATLEHATSTLVDAGASAWGMPCDVTSEASVDEILDHCLSVTGRLDIMVNNAGITRDATMRNLSYDDFRLVTDTLLSGTWLGCRAASRLMRAQGGGSIINISSIAGKIGNIGQTNYAAAKAGIIGLTKAAAKEVARVGIRVNAIQPGLVRTQMTEGLSPELWQSKLAAIPMGRAGEPREIANAALFLASDLSSYMTGATLEVTGGRDM